MLKIKQPLPKGNLLKPCGIHNLQVKMKLPRKPKSKYQIQSTRSKRTDILLTYQSVDSKHKLPPEHHVKARSSTQKLALVPDLSPQDIPVEQPLNYPEQVFRQEDVSSNPSRRSSFSP